ncbi:MAG: right-handed parallel beta-helix repeat-containing protein, partial [Planctomycetota bacterium]
MCRKICLMTFVLLLSISGAVRGTDYYVSPSGNDGAAGTSPSTAWQTISKVNTVDFDPGDGVLFEGGETFSGGLDFDASD